MEIWVDLGLVRNESDHPTEGGSSLHAAAIKGPLCQPSIPSRFLQATFYLLLLVNKVRRNTFNFAYLLLTKVEI